MAMKEIKSLNVEPSDESKTIELFQTFGWELKSTQDVRTADSQIFTGQDNDGTEHYQTEKGVHYIRIIFERDPARANYAELKSLEEQYYALKEPYCPYPPSFITLLWVILIGIGLIACIIPGVILLIVHIIVFVKQNKKYKKDYSVYTEEMNEFRAKQEEILTKARALV